MGQERFPRAGARHLRSRAANGKTPGRHDDRSATLSLDWDRSPSGNAWRMPRPRKRVLELSGGVGSRPQVPRWNAVRRARRADFVCADLRTLVCDARAASADADHRKTCAWRRSASFLLICMSYPGLNQRVRPEVAGPMTGSVKPGEVFAEHDRAKNCSHRRFRRDAMVLSGMFDALYGMPRAHIAPREGNFFASLRAKRSNPAPRYVLWIASSRSPSSGRPGVPIARARWGPRIAGRTCWLLAMTVGNRVATGPIAVLSRAACPSAQPSPRSAWRGAGLTE